MLYYQSQSPSHRGTPSDMPGTYTNIGEAWASQSPSHRGTLCDVLGAHVDHGRFQSISPNHWGTAPHAEHHTLRQNERLHHVSTLLASTTLAYTSLCHAAFYA